MGANKPLFRDLTADDPEPETTEIESMCMNCHAENGTTRLLLTNIPFYKQVVLMSFTCPECGYENNEIQSGAQIADKGIRITVQVDSERDLNRQVVKSDQTSVRIVEVDFEVPAGSQKGEVTTIEGIINRCVSGLKQDQSVRRIQHPETAKKIDEFVEKLEKLKGLSVGFTVILEDASGNCFVENPNAPQVDSQCTVQHFTRTTEQNHQLGIFTKDEISSEPSSGILHPIAEDEFPLEELETEVHRFPTNCPNCGTPAETNMKVTDIPHFKQVIIMATTCDACGHRTNEVKSGGGIESKGLRIEVDVRQPKDLTRDVLKSETCSLSIPQLELEVGPFALGGRFTTVEGLLVAMKEQLVEPMIGDSQTVESKGRMGDFLRNFDEVLEGKQAITLVLDDPAGNSYIQSLVDGDEVDDSLRIEHYERSFEQNEELGINDMVTEEYS